MSGEEEGEKKSPWCRKRRIGRKIEIEREKKRERERKGKK